MRSLGKLSLGKSHTTRVSLFLKEFKMEPLMDPEGVPDDLMNFEETDFTSIEVGMLQYGDDLPLADDVGPV